jgi:hypothetical protein
MTVSFHGADTGISPDLTELAEESLEDRLRRFLDSFCGRRGSWSDSVADTGSWRLIFELEVFHGFVNRAFDRLPLLGAGAECEDSALLAALAAV